MLVDFHTHVFPDKIAQNTISFLQQKCGNTPHTDGTVPGLIKNMQNADVDIAIALPILSNPLKFDSIINFAKGVNEQFKDCKNRIISFASIHPLCENINEKMRYIKESGFLGIKIHPEYQNTYINDDGYIKILKCAKDNDLIVVTHSGKDDGFRDTPVKCPPDLVLDVINKVGHSKFVLAHFGAHKQWDETYDKLCGKDVYFDTACIFNEIDFELFNKIIDKHGEDKILFATDCPWRDIKRDSSVLRSYNLDKDTQDKILYKNALKLLQMEI